jgi:hypothetical protein
MQHEHDDNAKTIRSYGLSRILIQHRQTLISSSIILSTAILLTVIFIIVHTTFYADKKIVQIENTIRSISAQERFSQVQLEILKRETELYRKASYNSSNVADKPFAIVIPYSKHHIKQLMNNFKTWSKHSPWIGQATHPVDIILYYDQEKTDETYILGQFKQYQLDTQFDRILFKYAKLIEPGKSNQFYALMDDKEFRASYPYFFYMDSNTFPIRSGWLKMLYDITYYRVRPFWVQGSTYRGERPMSRFYQLYIDANAIYSTSDEFHAFLTIVRNYRYSSFDADIFLFFMDKNEYRFDWHKYVYTDVILNLENSQRDIDTDSNRQTYLVHKLY